MYCDKIYVIKDGRVYAYGNPEEVLTEEIIKEVFEVDVSVSKDVKNGRISIMYYSKSMQKVIDRTASV